MDKDFMLADQDQDKQSIKRSMEGNSLEIWIAFGFFWGGTAIVVLVSILNG